MNPSEDFTGAASESSRNAQFKCKLVLEIQTFQSRIKVDRLSMSDPLEMRAFILLSEEDLDDYDAEITRLRSQLVHVQTRRKRLNDFKMQLQSFLSPLCFQKFTMKSYALFSNRSAQTICCSNILGHWTAGLGGNQLKPTTHLPLPTFQLFPSTLYALGGSLTLALPRLWSQFRLETASKDGTTSDVSISSIWKICPLGRETFLSRYICEGSSIPILEDLNLEGYY
ncbi:hypothetical protein BT96DRAFT_1001198 [Gymnopus androsaceus JB14]|uniref:Uncharacterized protein n=1 Tax=Gymnopus androsaceus JB14 TaxID=1447944 RepID=A0A6A4H1K9_9AGAR|nr:hypothetical protein BT96DRAFT_1001198 [Gymnopus androsaceus JB14]